MQVFSLGKENTLPKINIEQERKRNFCLLLYPDCPEHNEIISNIASNAYSFDYAGILHDKDITDDGDNKKPYYHFVVHFNNACTRGAFAKNLGLDERFIQDCKDYKNALMYLVHYKNQEKAQYSNELVFGTLAEKVRELTSKLNETSSALKILDLLDSIEGFISKKDFLRLVCDKGLFSTFRRNNFYFAQIIDEHNIQFSKIHNQNC